MSDTPRTRSNRKTKTKYESYQDAKPNGAYKSQPPNSSPHPPPHKSQQNEQVNHPPHPSSHPPHPSSQPHPSSRPSSHSPHPQSQSSPHPSSRSSHSPHPQSQSSPHPQPHSSHPHSQSQSSPHPQSHSSHAHSQSQPSPHPHPHPNGSSRRGSRHDRNNSGSHPSSAHHNSPHPNSQHHPSSSSHHSSHSSSSQHQPSRDRQDQPPQPQNVNLKSSQPLSYPAELTPAQIESHLLQMWNAAFDRSRNMKIPEHERPTIYRDAVRAWGNDTKNPVLGDFNFCTELKKSYIAKFGGGQVTKEDENGKVETTNDNNNNIVNNSNSFGKNVNTNESINNINNATDTNNTNNTQNNNDINNTTKNKTKKNKREMEERTNGQTNKTEQHTSKEQPSTQDSKQKPKQQQERQGKEKQERQGQEKQQEEQQEKQQQKQQEKQKEQKQEKELKTKEEALEPETQQKGKEDSTEANKAAESEQYTYGFTNDAYEEISDLADSKGNPGDVIIDIPDVDDEDDVPQPTKVAQNGKVHAKPKAKKGKKGKGKPAKHHETEKEKTEPKNSSSNNNVNNNNYGNNILSLASNGTNEAWNDILGTLLPRPKTEIIKASGTNTLHLNNAGNFTLAQTQAHAQQPSQDSEQTHGAQQVVAQAQNALLAGIPREVVRVFAHRFSKPNTNAATSAEYPGMLPVKWSSGDGLMSAGRKFPMEVPFLSLKDMFGSSKPSSKLSCANLKCQNTTTDDKPFKTCAKCNMTAYCSRECQVEDWAKRHKQQCKSNAAEEQRKTFATQKFWATASIRHMIFLHWYSRYGKGVIVVMCKDFLSFGEDDPSGRELYLFYMPMADLMSDDCPIPALKKCQAEFAKSFVNHDSDSQSIASAAVDSTGFVTPLIDEVKVLQLKLHKRSCKDHDLQKVDAIAVDSHNQATLYTFH